MLVISIYIFYVQMLEGRGSDHVLDGLLYHESELQIYNHQDIQSKCLF